MKIVNFFYIGLIKLFREINWLYFKNKISTHDKVLISPFAGIFGIIGRGTLIDVADSVEIGNYVMISFNTRITDNNNHSIKAKDRKKDLINLFDHNIYDNTAGINNVSRAIKVGNHVWIGRDSLILKGVTIGDGAIVAAKAVVTHNVPPNTIVAGNPAKVVKKILNNAVE